MGFKVAVPQFLMKKGHKEKAECGGHLTLKLNHVDENSTFCYIAYIEKSKKSHDSMNNMNAMFRF